MYILLWLIYQFISLTICDTYLIIIIVIIINICDTLLIVIIIMVK